VLRLKGTIYGKGLPTDTYADDKRMPSAAQQIRRYSKSCPYYSAAEQNMA